MFRFILCIAFIFNVVSAKTQKSYEGSQVLLIPSEALNLLKHQFKTGGRPPTTAGNVVLMVDNPAYIREIGAEVWRADEINKEIFVTSRALAEVDSILDRNHVNFTVLTQDVQKAIDNEHLHKKLSAVRMIKEGKKMSWNAYHRLEDIYNFTEQLAKDHPHRVKVVNIGKSVHGRQLKVAIFKSGIKNAKRIWLDGGIHAREWVSPAVVTYIMRELAMINGSDSSPLSQIDFYVCPVVNPDGYEYSHTTDRLWRKNRHIMRSPKGVCHGVDLNRNFQAQWVSSEKCDDQYPGTKPESEPETKHITKFILQNLKNMEGFITFHSYSQVILYPYGYPIKKDSIIQRTNRYRAMVKIGEDIADKVNHVDGGNYKSVEIFKYTKGAYGSSVDWAMDIGINYTYAIELRPDGSSLHQPGFMLPPNQIIPTAKEAMAAVTVLATAVVKKSR